MKIMKTKLMGIAAITALAFSVQAHEGQITIYVTDENGIGISNAQAVVQFENILPAGEGWGSGRPTEEKGITDTNGNWTISGNSTGGSASIRVSKDGYYYGSTEVIFTNVDSILNRWQPWNPTVNIVLKQKGIQMPMYARRVERMKIPVEDTPVGFDLMVGDWVGPYGKGQTPDFVFKFESKPEPEMPPREIRPFDVTLTLSFSNDGDGIQSVFTPPHSSSELRLPRQAPVEGYEPVLLKHQQTEAGQVPKIEFREDQNYFFRVRTKKDAQGNIISAMYGKISGDFNQEDGGFLVRGWLSFTYYLNPVPNNQDMEFNPKLNLSKNLKFMEGVSAP